MRKTYSMLLALLLTAAGAVNANAGKMISLDEVPFTTWEGYGIDASQGEPATCAWVIGEPTGQPYGDASVINGADLSLYSKLVITYTEGTPRVLLNRDVPEGQWNSDEAESKLIEFPKDGWSSKYFSNNTDDGVLIVDLKQIKKDKGYVRLHAIKGANWGNVTVVSMEVETQSNAQQVGWTNLITNGDMEGEDNSCFWAREENADPVAWPITDGDGRDGSRGVKVHAAAGAAQDWDAQFWINLPETLAPDTKYRVSFDYRSSIDGSMDTQAHRDPSDYIHYEMLGTINTTPDWQTFTAEGTLTAQQSGETTMHSIAFNLSKDRANDVDFYFDNIKFEVYKYGTTVEYSMDVLKVDFGFDTNIPELVKACGKPRLLFPTDMVTVTSDNEAMEIMTVEGFPDGRFYIFLEDGLEEDAEVEVSLKNPADAAYHLVYTSGPGGDVTDFSVPAVFNDEITVEDAYSYNFVKPTVIAADPEDGSFNLPNSIKEFKITFDKPADCSKLVATLNGKALAVNPSEGFEEQVTLVRSGDDLPDGLYILKLDKIFSEDPLVEDDYGTFTLNINVGKVVYDPNDLPKEMLPDYFATTEANGIPEGYILTFGEEIRTAEGGSYGSGPRMFNFSEGGDFTKGLYYREGYVEYGSTAGYPLPLEAGKKYNVRFNTAMWKDNGNLTLFQILTEAGDPVISQMINNNPNVNGATTAVTGSTVTEIQFIPDATANYLLRWTAAQSEEGNTGFFEIILANPSVRYIPNQVGIEETQLLNTALENAKAVRDGNNSARYDGEIFNALVAAIDKYEAEMTAYTAPSAFRKAAADLDAKAQAMKDHRTLCDKFDTTAASAMQTVLDNAENKFAKSELYAQLKGIAEKWAVADVDDEGNVYVAAKVVKDDATLSEAIAEMEQIAKVAAAMFSEGESVTGDAGIEVLVDRVRQGAEGLMEMGVSEDDELIVLANNALTDDDELAEAMKNRLKLEFYNKMKNGDNSLFAPTGEVDPETEEPITKTYNFTVFAKNPNIYAWSVSAQYSPENVPGWDVPIGSGELNTIWVGGTPRNIEGVPEDVAFTKYHQRVRMQQTVYDLPAGIYNVIIDATNWADDDNTDGYAFIKTSATPEVEEGIEEDPAVNFADTLALNYHGQYVGHHDNVFTVEVVDGILTFGCNFGAQSQYEFDHVKIMLSGAAAGFDYAKGYEEVLTSIDNAPAANVKVRAIEVYDLNGRRLYNAQKGVNILRKQMSDGTIRIEKVVIK